MNNDWDDLMGSEEAASTYMDSYGEGVGAQTRHELGAFINNGESVLDVGCGPGWNYDHFKQYGPDVIYRGEDYSHFFVDAANKRHSDTFYLGDCRKLDHPDKSWDVVVLMDCLEHTSGYEQPLAEALRVAKKRIIVTFWHLGEDDLTERMNIDGNDGFGYWYSRPRWERFLDWQQLHWLHHQFNWPGDRQRDYYIIDLEQS